MGDSKRLVPHQRAQLPAVSAPSLPDFPSSSGQFALTRRSQAVKDAAYVRAHADLIRARKEQVDAAREYSEARYQLALALSKWQHIDEVCQHEYQKGFLGRESELKVLALELETREINARIARDQAMLTLQAYQLQPAAETLPTAPSAAAPSPPVQPKGLTPADVRAALQQYPDIRPEAIDPIIMMLTGLLAEKGQ